MITLHMAWRNIWRHKRRTWLTMAGIGFSTFLFVFVMPLQFGAYDMMIDASLRTFTGYAQVQSPGYQAKPFIHNTIANVSDLAARLRQHSEFEAVAVRASGFALLSSTARSYGAQVVGVEAGYEQGVSMIPGNTRVGHFLSADDAKEIVIGAALARNLKVKVGDEVTLLGSGRDGSLAATFMPIVGIFETGTSEMDRYLVEMPLKTFQSVFSMGDSAHSIAVVGHSVQERDQIPDQLRAVLGGRPDLAIIGWGELMPGLKEGVEMDKISGLLFMLVLVVVVVFSILNTFLMSVLERTKEFGLMLALGERPGGISRLVMMESTLLTLLGLSMGIVLGIAINIYYLDVGFRYPGLEELAQQYNIPLDVMYPQFNFFNIMFGPMVVFIATNVAAWIPLLRIHRLKPVEAMRTV